MIQKFSVLQFEAYLRTAKLGDIYEKYYSDIPEEIFYQIISADPSLDVEEDQKPKKMGKYGQWLLRMYKNKQLPLEDLEKTHDLLYDIMSMATGLKKKKVTFDVNKFKSISELFSFVAQYEDIVEPKIDSVQNNPEKLLTNTFFLDDGQAKLRYEDEESMVVVPLTLEASQFYGAGTNWCTVYPGNFKNYTTNYPPDNTLWVVIYKQDPLYKRFQLHFPSQQFMDIDDRPVDVEYVLSKPLIAFFKATYFSPETLEQLTSNQDVLISKEVSVSYLVQDQWLATWIEDLYENPWECFNIDVSISDLYYLDFDDKNIEILKSYLHKKQPELLSEYEEENGDIDWNNQKELLNLIEFINDSDLNSVCTQAYENAWLDAATTNVFSAIKKAFSEHYNLDFSAWWPGGPLKIPVEKVKDLLDKHWFQLAGLDLTKPFSIINLIEECNEISTKSLQNVIDIADNNSFVSDEDFNQSFCDTWDTYIAE